MDKPKYKNKYIFRLFSSLIALFGSRDTINFKNVRPKYIKYMFIFPLAPVFANMQGSLFTGNVRLFGLDAMTLMGCAYCLGAGALFAFSKVGNMALVSRISAIITAAAFVPWLVIPESHISLLLAVVFMFGLGGCAACACFSYTFALNNTERFLGAAMISLFFVLMQLDYGMSLLSHLFSRLYISALVAGAVICLMLYKQRDFSDISPKRRATLNPPVKLMLYFFVAHCFVEIFYTYLPGASTTGAIVSNGLVGILAMCLSVVTQMIAKRSVWHMCNLFFVAIICTYALYFMPEGSAGRDVARWSHGFEQVGYIASYYLLGCVFKKHGDFRLFKICLVIILPASMLYYLIPGVISAYAPEFLPLAAILASGTLFLVFVLLSPAYSKHLFSTAWSDDFHRIDMTGTQMAAEHAGRLEYLNLSTREKEVAALLLQGKSTKEIAGNLGISANTANFHIKHVYRKLGIGSRSELFARFSSHKPSPESQIE